MTVQEEDLNKDTEPASMYRVVTEYYGWISCLEKWLSGITLDQVRKMYRKKYPPEEYGTLVLGGFRDGILTTRMERRKFPAIVIILGQ